MSKLTKSPLRVAREALAVARQCLRPYTHKFSPKKFTQPQLFACLVLKTFLKTDYRGLACHLADHSDLRDVLGLQAVPHFTTPQKASRRLLQQPRARRLFRTTIRRFLGRRRRVPRAALDSTGLECGHASRHYIRRRNGVAKQWQTVAYSYYAKLEAAFDCTSHLLVGVLLELLIRQVPAQHVARPELAHAEVRQRLSLYFHASAPRRHTYTNAIISSTTNTTVSDIAKVPNARSCTAIG